jgi:hypothetical protein
MSSQCTCNFSEQNRKIMSWLRLSASMTYYSSLRVLLFYFVILKNFTMFPSKKTTEISQIYTKKHIFPTKKSSIVCGQKNKFCWKTYHCWPGTSTLPQWTSSTTQQDTIHCMPNAHYDSLCGWTSTELISGFTLVTHSVRSRSCMYR